MPKKLLNLPNICTAIKHVSCERVPHLVRRYPSKPGSIGSELKDSENHVPNNRTFLILPALIGIGHKQLEPSYGLSPSEIARTKVFDPVPNKVRALAIVAPVSIPLITIIANTATLTSIVALEDDSLLATP